MKVADWTARIFITLSGLGTIVAVTTVFVFLVFEASILFFPASISAPKQVTVATGEKIAPVHMGTDEDRLLCWTLLSNGKVTVTRLSDGKQVQPPKDLFEDQSSEMTALSQPVHRQIQEARKIRFQEIGFGFKDGSARIVRFRFHTVYKSRFATEAEMQKHFQSEDWEKEHGRAAVLSYVPLEERKGLNGWRVFTALVQPIVKAKKNRSAITRIDYSASPTGNKEGFCILREDGSLGFNEVQRKKSLLDGSVRLKAKEYTGLPYTPDAGRGPPRSILLAVALDQIFLLWENGDFERIDIRDPRAPAIAEKGNLLQAKDARITKTGFLVGKTTLIVGDSLGRARAWFMVNSEQAQTTDGAMLVNGHTFEQPGAQVTALGASEENRLLAIGYNNGKVRLVYVTSEKELGEVVTENGRAVEAVALAPKTNAFLAVAGDRLWQWPMDQGHPEVTFSSLFFPVWYEGAKEPDHTWQSTGGEDSFESKFGMWPMVFGTLKAAFYSLLFGVPLALLAAIYTSEFMRPRARALIKPTIELMAGLPSVVLGFLAGLVLAQFVENVISAVLATFIMLPITFMLASHLVMLLPEKVSRVFMNWRLLFLFPTVGLGILLGTLLGPLLEQLFFSGSLREWLDTGKGSSVGGWMFLFLPLSALIVALLAGRYLTPELRRWTSTWSRQATALADLAKFLIVGFAILLLSLGLSFLLDLLNFDARGIYLGVYSQRNALVVGFVMGFAIIPIIYTIAEDALSSVPGHLRSGSLAAGATPWQTAVRIIIPTAMSGLFSAVMIGMGRAIGETMIVLMATGNTPVTEWNIFNGFRTLSAGIAVELPEAAKGDTHYRTLFLAALILFAMTFVLNTLAEVVRLRFRKRAYQL